MAQKISLVLDINVYANAFARNDKYAQACFYLIEQRTDFTLVTSEYIIEKTEYLLKQELEYDQVLLEEAFEKLNTLLDNLEAKDQLDYSDTHAFSLEATTIYDLSRDDSHIYKLGFRNSPSIIITNDHDFEQVRNRDRSIAIMSPKEFVERTKRSSKNPPTKPREQQFGKMDPFKLPTWPRARFWPTDLKISLSRFSEEVIKAFCYLQKLFLIY